MEIQVINFIKNLTYFIIEMSEMMYKDSYRNITNIDISSVVVEKMNNLYQDDFEEMMCKKANIFKFIHHSS